MNEPLVSIVITTKNEENSIGRCLQSISQQTYSNIEVIVVDNHSSDKTRDISRQWTDKIHVKGPERSAQRNFGLLHAANGLYAAYFDADMIISSNLIENCVLHLQQQNQIGALYLPEVVLGCSFFARVRRYEREFYIGTPVDAVRFFRRNDFIKVGGFDEVRLASAGPEDWDLDKRLKGVTTFAIVQNQKCQSSYGADWLNAITYPLGILNDSSFCGIYHDESDMTLMKYLKKKKYYANSFSNYTQIWGTKDPDIRVQLKFRYRFFYIYLSKNKHFRIIQRPHLFFAMIALKILTGLTVAFQLVKANTRVKT